MSTIDHQAQVLMSKNDIDEFTDVGLTIGSLGVSVQCDDRALADRLLQPYSLFPLLRHPIFRLEITIEHRAEPGQITTPLFTIDQARMVFDTRTIRGEVDLMDGKGQLTINVRFAKDQIDYILRVIYSFLSIVHGGLMLHGAGVKHNEFGLAFFGQSGIGKTTLARMSAGLSKNIVLNDDLIYLSREETGWKMHSTPFTNPGQVPPVAISCDLSALFRLRQSRRVRMVGLSSGQALAELIANIPIVPSFSPYIQQVFQNVEVLLSQVPIYQLDFRPDNTLWQVIDRQFGTPDFVTRDQ